MNSIFKAVASLTLISALCTSSFSLEASEAAIDQTVNAETPGAVYFIPPKGWRLADTNMLGKNVQLMVVGTGKAGFPPSINLTTENYQGNLKDYLKIVKSINEAKGNTWKDLGKIQTDAGEGSLSQLDTKMQWGDVRMLHTIVIKDNVVYILTAAALRDEYPSYYKEFFESMRSLHINPSET